MSTTADKKRPGADGHRFGPDLHCSECGISWELHQDEPHPCDRAAEGEGDQPEPSISLDPEEESAIADSKPGQD